METLSDKLSACLVIGDQQVAIAELKKKLADKYKELEQKYLDCPETREFKEFYIKGGMWAIEWVQSLL